MDYIEREKKIEAMRKKAGAVVFSECHKPSLADGEYTLGSPKKEVGKISNTFKVELEALKEENTKLKETLTEQIPHKEKLKNAIQLVTLEAKEKGFDKK
tara:strand:+ start:91 stop:387 length:297 start_codon:yes stop_codon:yes gene_type:complete